MGSTFAPCFAAFDVAKYDRIPVPFAFFVAQFGFIPVLVLVRF